jgi:DNA-directed RNA polymerase subunit RPC12/RpoP
LRESKQQRQSRYLRNRDKILERRRTVYYPANREREIARAAKWRAENLEHRQKWEHEYHIKNRARRREWHLKNEYGVSQADFERQLKAQDGKCAICKREITLTTKKAFIDHNHSTKAIRGILCPPCNFILGNCKESIQILLSAIQYLEGTQNAAAKSRRV